ncbi:MAG: 2-amino-4-hydroxy-6-hydroxymethyldihydropteridine diphosphokinase [Candidatus Marinimicrobia bacterium]|nr:2-amino-4-hydroxy-6-hydroxymethyldihydropteridine diphosphokinase [Candidatus Neomarinimicrobiota bacterium]
MAEVVLGLGSNLNNRQKLLMQAVKKLSQKIGALLDYSSIYETEPLYFQEQPDFLNLVVMMKTKLSPLELLDSCQKIEKEMGRKRGPEKNRPRLIDIDILYFNAQVVNENRLQIPHPKIKERKFVLKPLSEMAAHYIDPASGRSIKQLYENCSDNSRVILFKNRKKLTHKLDSL